MHPSRTLAIVFLFASWWLASGIQASTPAILVSIKPIHSLVSALTQGISQPALLLQGTQSPHDYALKPSDRRLIHDADLIIYTSPMVEGFMHALEHKLDPEKMLVMTELPGIVLLPARSLDSHGHHAEASAAYDGHIWLSVANAKIMSQELYQYLRKSDAANGEQYARNLHQLLAQLDKLDSDIRQQLTTLKDKPFMIYHDAFQYFEKSYGLHNSIFVTPSPEQQPGIRQVSHLRTIIQQNHIQCIFYEPPQLPPILKTITEGQAVRLLPLDPTGAELKAGETLYFNLMRNIARQLSTCLGS